MNVITIPVINRPDLLAATVASIDYPYDVLTLVDNSGSLGMGDVAEDNLPDCIGELVVVEPPANLGVAASWNLAIRSYPKADSWTFANADVEFAPGDLAGLNSHGADAIDCLLEFAAFSMTPGVVDALGFFDENFHPVYCEDSDYRYRAKLGDIPIVDLGSGDSTHVGSVCYRGGPHATDNARTYPANVDYYRAKWGGWIGQEKFTTPFDLGVGIDWWRLDRTRLADQEWTPR